MWQIHTASLIGVLLSICLWSTSVSAEPPRPSLRFPGAVQSRPFPVFSAHIEEESAGGPYPAAVAPYPAAGQKPEPPFEYGPPPPPPPLSTPAPTYGPPSTTPADRYGPPPKPQPSYGPPPAPESSYGPPPAPETSYGPPLAEPEPEQVYGPPEEPEPAYGPPQPQPTPRQSYGPPAQPQPHETYGPPPQTQPQPAAPEDNNSLPQSASILAEAPFPPQRQLTLPRFEKLVAFRPRGSNVSIRRRPSPFGGPEKLRIRSQQQSDSFSPSNRQPPFRRFA